MICMAYRAGGAAPGNGDFKGGRSSWGVHEGDVEGNGSSSKAGAAAAGAAATGVPVKPMRTPKKKARQCSLGFFLAILCVVAITFLGCGYIERAFIVLPGGDSGQKDYFFDHTDDLDDGGDSLSRKSVLSGLFQRSGGQGFKRRADRELKFGQGFRSRQGYRDSRDWDSDDRNRSYDSEEDPEETFDREYAKLQKELQGNPTSPPAILQKELQGNPTSPHAMLQKELQGNPSGPAKLQKELRGNPTSPAPESALKGSGLLYERGRKELRMYEKQYEAEMNSSSTIEEADEYDEYEGKDEESQMEAFQTETSQAEGTLLRRAARGVVNNVQKGAQKVQRARRSRRGGPCQISFLKNSSQLKEPDNSSMFAQFQLVYVSDEPKQPPKFAGHQSWEERENSFKATNQTLHCGFVGSSNSSDTTGFDISERDKKFLGTCRVAVSSCIFGKSDQLHAPHRKTLSSSSKKEACLVLFVDQSTLDVMIQEGQVPDEDGYVGLWRVVLVKNLPYTDLRLAGKIPKFLSHRLFPSARFSIWLDSKLRLQSDPLSILEYFLWRGNHEYAISNHYDRHCVWDEVQQNKRLNKFNHTAIDEQFRYYQSDGLVKFNASDPHRPLPSYVPEGSFIVREHTPMSNLFSCLWFNEAERFTPRDQLSFAYTYLKLARTNPDVRFRLNMFKDCERKAIAKLFRHRRQTG